MSKSDSSNSLKLSSEISRIKSRATHLDSSSFWLRCSSANSCGWNSIQFQSAFSSEFNNTKCADFFSKRNFWFVSVISMRIVYKMVMPYFIQPKYLLTISLIVAHPSQYAESIRCRWNRDFPRTLRSTLVVVPKCDWTRPQNDFAIMQTTLSTLTLSVPMHSDLIRWYRWIGTIHAAKVSHSLPPQNEPYLLFDWPYNVPM